MRECDASELAAIEQELMAEGMPVQEIMGMCDLHSQVVRDILVEKAAGVGGVAVRDLVAALRRAAGR